MGIPFKSNNSFVAHSFVGDRMDASRGPNPMALQFRSLSHFASTAAGLIICLPKPTIPARRTRPFRTLCRDLIDRGDNGGT
jgi:hypothetical protein